MPDAMPSPPRVLPPKALLLSILAQLPLAVWMWPLHPSVVEVALGSVVLNCWNCVEPPGGEVFRRRDVGVRPSVQPLS